MLATKQKLGYLEGWLSIVLEHPAVRRQVLAGSRVGSVSMVADAWHTLSRHPDLGGGHRRLLRSWPGRPTSAHPFGHARAENISAIVIGVLLAVVGALLRLGVGPAPVGASRRSPSPWSAILVFAARAAKEGLAQFAFWAGRKTGSQAVRRTAGTTAATPSPRRSSWPARCWAAGCGGSTARWASGCPC